MTKQVGRCNNLELCTVAVSQRIMTVPAGAQFVCEKCGEPLVEPISASSPRRRTASILVQLVVLIAGLSAIAWKLTGPGGDFTGVRSAWNSLRGGPDQQTAPAPVMTAAVTPASVTPTSVTPVTVTPASVTPAIVTPASEMAAPASDVETASAATSAIAATSITAQGSKPDPASAGAIPAPGMEPTAAVAVAAVPTISPRPPVPSTVLLRLAGSDSVTPKLIRRLASSYLALIGDTSISAVPGGTPRLIEVSGLQTGQREVISILETSSTGGFNALLRGTADMAVSNRKLTGAEADRMQTIGDLTIPAHEHVIAVVGIAVIVSPTNRVASLSAGQVRGILGGKITNWSEVGGMAAPIKVQVVAVPEDGGDTPQDVILAAEAISPAAIRSVSEQAVATRVVSDRDSFGVVTMGAAGAAKVMPISDGGAAATVPSEATLASESYPFSQRIYLYGVNAGNGFIRRFSDYVSSANGQAAVEAAGYVSLAIKTEVAAAPDVASERYKQLVQGATRVAVDFRFQPGSVDLDSRSARDMDRVIAFLKAQRVPANKIVVAAFADNSGQAATNQAVSQRRAEVVASALARGGFVPGKIASFGSEVPIADNATAEGRERNRRVEVFLVP